MRKLLIFILKYIPIAQSVGMLINNILYIINKFPTVCFIIDFIIGNSLLMFLFVLIASHVFKFCNWHRALVYGNFINIIIGYLNYIIFTDNIYIYNSTISITTIFITIFISLYFKFCTNEKEHDKTCCCGTS